MCRAKLTPSAGPVRFHVIYVAEETQRRVRWICETCWQRHLEFEAEFSRANPVEEVCAALRDDDVSVRGEAARKLMRLRDPRAVDPLLDALGSEVGSVMLEESAADVMIAALAAIGGPEVEKRLLGLLRVRAYWIKIRVDIDEPLVPAVECVIPALLKMGGSELVLRGLLDVLGDQQPMLRWYAARELARIAASSAFNGIGAHVLNKLTDSDRELILGPLRAALRDEFLPVQRAAAIALGHLGDRSALDDLLAGLADGDHRIRYSAAQALGDLGDLRAVEPLRGALGSNISVAAMEALAKLRGR
ncbi:HEAT repeat domain-containing protein [Streptomyces xiangluensis]|uniref:HEAT repeat domain-containing protein n=1 Tax=Streptomyces xiangluensis TaxID=2665720 RepID=A0ABV8Z0K0_9ACTN